MPKHTLKLLFLLAAFAVAPANAGHRRGPPADQSTGEPACPHERARLAAALAQRPPTPTRVTLVAGIRNERPLRNVAPGAYFTP